MASDPNATIVPSPPAKRPRNPKFSFDCGFVEISYADLLEKHLETHPESVLPVSGSRVKASSLIKSAMNRLEQYGALANPTEVGRHYDSKSDLEEANEQYYDLDDGFIDDSEVKLEEVSDEDWTKALGEGFYCLPAKEFKEEPEKKVEKDVGKRRKKKEKKHQIDVSEWPNEVQRIVLELREMYSDQKKKTKIVSGLKKSLCDLVKEVGKCRDSPSIEVSLISLLQSITKLPSDTLSVPVTQTLYQEATDKAVIDSLRNRYFLSLQTLRNTLSRICLSQEPSISPEAVKQYLECQRLLGEVLSVKGSRPLNESDQRAKISALVKEASFAKFGEGDILAKAGESK